ncbi:MAG: hypothetical protein M3Q36_03840 [bacterium]|nr:hypothetical protein [bacterium]
MSEALVNVVYDNPLHSGSVYGASEREDFDEREPYNPALQEIPRDLRDSIASGSGEIAAGQVAEVIQISLEEESPAVRPPTLHGTAISLEGVRVIVRDKLLSRDERLKKLLSYAWESESPDEPIVPERLLKFIPNSPVDWMSERDAAHESYDSMITNIKRLELYLASHNRDGDSNRYKIDEIIEETMQYNMTPLLRNLRFMNHQTMGLPEVARAELITRMILYEADLAADSAKLK